MTTPTFAEAQARLAARRRARETESQARHATQQSASALRARLDATPSGSLSHRLGAYALHAWDAVSSREGTRPAFRVGQVDAELLDQELLELLQAQVGDALRLFAGGKLLDGWEPEVLLALRAALFKLTLWDHDASYGAALQNLRYTDARRPGPVPEPPSRWQKAAYGIVTVAGRYAWTKWEDWLLRHDDDDDSSSGGDNDDGGDGHGRPRWLSRERIGRLARLTTVAGHAHAAAALLSFLVFLAHGRYRTLLDRVLRMRLAPPTSQVGREVSFEYLNRQLVWHAFTEFLLFVLPLVGVGRWRRWLGRAWRRTRLAAAAARRTGDDEASVAGGGGGGEYAFLPERTCAVCYAERDAAATGHEALAAAAASGGIVGSAATDITNPYEAVPCGCVYCYVCLATRLEAEEGEGWPCLRCGDVARACRPWGGDVLDPPGRSSPTHKTVGFADDVKGGGGGSASEAVVLVEGAEAEVDDGVESLGSSSAEGGAEEDGLFLPAEDGYHVDEEDGEAAA